MLPLISLQQNSSREQAITIGHGFACSRAAATGNPTYRLQNIFVGPMALKGRSRAASAGNLERSEALL